MDAGQKVLDRNNQYLTESLNVWMHPDLFIAAVYIAMAAMGLVLLGLKIYTTEKGEDNDQLSFGKMFGIQFN